MRRASAGSRVRGALRTALVPIVVAAALGAALLDREIGVARWWTLERDLVRAEERIETLRSEIRALEVEARALRGDAFAIERAIREDLDLALPGEIVVRTRPPAHTLARAP